MARLLVYYAHPGHRTSHVNRAMAEIAQSIDHIAFVDLYRLYPRHNIDIAAEQGRLIASDVVLFQFPLFWYSTPSLIKEWEDLVLEHGFAYGSGGDRLADKTMMLAVTAAGAEDAYAASGYQNFPLRTFLTPLEQTARLCRMRFTPPYVLFSSLSAPTTDEMDRHVQGYRHLLTAIRDDAYDFDRADQKSLITHDALPLNEAARQEKVSHG